MSDTPALLPMPPLLNVGDVFMMYQRLLPNPVLYTVYEVTAIQGDRVSAKQLVLCAQWEPLRPHTHPVMRTFPRNGTAELYTHFGVDVINCRDPFDLSPAGGFTYGTTEPEQSPPDQTDSYWKHGYCEECNVELTPAMDGEGATLCRKHQ